MIMFTTNDLYPQGYLFLSLIGGFIILIGLLIKSKEDTIFPKYYWFPILFIPVSSFFLLYMLLTKTALNEIEYISIILCFILNFIAFIFLYSQITNLIQKKIEQQIGDEQKKGRLDLRNELIITIDGADAKDLDDAVSLKLLDNAISNYESSCPIRKHHD